MVNPLCKVRQTTWLIKLFKSLFLVTGLALVVSTLFVGTGFADNVRHVVWNKDFIPIDVPIGKEKIVEVCASSSDPSGCKTIPLTPYLPEEEVSNGSLKWINNNGTLYLNATKPFSNKLVELKLNDSVGTVVLVRLSASSSADDDRIEIMLPPSQDQNKQNGSGNSTAQNQTEDKSIGDMVRWVSQQLYAPKRLLTQPNWIVRTPMHTDRFVSLYRGDVVSSMPLASWRAGDYYVTAVLLRSVLQNEKLHLSYDMLRGQWIAASFFRQSDSDPSVLTPARTDGDTTTLILISTSPFDASLKEGEGNA